MNIFEEQQSAGRAMFFQLDMLNAMSLACMGSLLHFARLNLVFFSFKVKKNFFFSITNRCTIRLDCSINTDPLFDQSIPRVNHLYLET